MAVTKIHAIKSKLNKALAYIENPDKTEDQLLVSGYNVDPLMASVEMEMTAALAREANGGGGEKGKNLAYHMIQSFSPEDEVTPEQAHEIGKKLADNFLEGKYEYVISTHVDKGHIHNHIIFNAVSFYHLKKIETRPYKTAAKIRAISDQLCAENNLSVIPKGQRHGCSYKEYAERRRNNSWKSELRKRMNYLLQMATSYEQVKKVAGQLGISIEERGKELTYLLDGQKRCIRASKLSDDDTYTKGNIVEQTRKNFEMKTLLQAEIETIVKEAGNYAEFLQVLRTKGIVQRRKKSGEVMYHFENFDGGTLQEAVLGDGYSTESIRRAIQEGKYEFSPKEADIVAQYNKTSHSEVKDKGLIAIELKEDFIERITAEGILMKLPDGEGLVFIDNRHIDLNEQNGQYTVYIGSLFDYYIAPDKHDPDVAISDQLCNKCIRGEKIIRKMQLTNNVQPEQVECFSIDSITEKGVSVSLENGSKFFIESEFVSFERQSGRCWLQIFSDWTYGTKKNNKIENLTGRELLNQLPGKNSSLEQNESVMLRRLRAAERRINVSDAAAVAEALLLIRQEGYGSKEDIVSAMTALQREATEINKKVDEMKQKNEQYKTAAKYLIAYAETVGVQKTFEECGKLRREAFRRDHSEELQKHLYAIKQLEKMGVNTNVDPEKVLELVRKQEEKAKNLIAEMETINLRISQIKAAYGAVQRIENQEYGDKREISTRIKQK